MRLLLDQDGRFFNPDADEEAGKPCPEWYRGRRLPCGCILRGPWSRWCEYAARKLQSLVPDSSDFDQNLRRYHLHIGMKPPTVGGVRMGLPEEQLESAGAMLDGPAPRAEGHRSGYVYLIAAENGLYKIGCSPAPSARLLELQLLSPVGLEMTHCFPAVEMRAAEGYLHRLFRHRRHHGEWFALSQEDAETIMRIRAWRGKRSGN